jgi:hypothetical protein
MLDTFCYLCGFLSSSIAAAFCTFFGLIRGVRCKVLITGLRVDGSLSLGIRLVRMTGSCRLRTGGGMMNSMCANSFLTFFRITSQVITAHICYTSSYCIFPITFYSNPTSPVFSLSTSP